MVAKHDKRLRIFTGLMTTSEDIREADASDCERFLASDAYFCDALGNRTAVVSLERALSQYENVYGSVVELNGETLKNQVHLMLPACRQQVLRVMDDGVLLHLSHYQKPLYEMANELREHVMSDSVRASWPVVGRFLADKPGSRVCRLSQKLLSEVMTEQSLLGLELIKRLLSSQHSMSMQTLLACGREIVEIAECLSQSIERPEAALPKSKLVAFEREYCHLQAFCQKRDCDLIYCKPTRFSGFQKGRQARQRLWYLKWHYEVKTPPSQESIRTVESLRACQETLKTLSPWFQRATRACFVIWQFSLIQDSIHAILMNLSTTQNLLDLSPYKSVLPKSLFSDLEKIVTSVQGKSRLDITAWRECLARVNQRLRPDQQFFLPTLIQGISEQFRQKDGSQGSSHLSEADQGSRVIAQQLREQSEREWELTLETINPRHLKRIDSLSKHLSTKKSSRPGETPGYAFIREQLLRHSLEAPLAPKVLAILTTLTQEVKVNEVSQREFLLKLLSCSGKEKGNVFANIDLSFSRANSTESWHQACLEAHRWVLLWAPECRGKQTRFSEKALSSIVKLANHFESSFTKNPPSAMTSGIEDFILALLATDALEEPQRLKQLLGPVTCNLVLKSNASEAQEFTHCECEALLKRLPQAISQLSLDGVEKRLAGVAPEWPTVLFPLTRRELESLADLDPRDPRGFQIVGLLRGLLDSALLPKAQGWQVNTLLSVMTGPEIVIREQAIDQYLDRISRESARQKPLEGVNPRSSSSSSQNSSSIQEGLAPC